MNQKYFNEKGHISESGFAALHAEQLSDMELITVCEHMAECDTCADTFANGLTEAELIPSSSGFDEMLKENFAAQNRNKFQLLTYSLRVALAACAALVIVFSGLLNPMINAVNTQGNFSAPQFSFISTINAKLHDFSQSLLQWEVPHNEKKGQ